ncbi:hypothetical protein PAF17_06055 [Paracoccus sp. Z330]|uniref:Transporter n=1 Tax=Paracoccus onchidii TaxID=3017813 RepID=A0ABT4ZDK5_9RHOB|nr:hypothetical protein [Paracoccus onchidii]MDB6177068.1 hypothetical protein [Paracoccus onchidii]
MKRTLAAALLMMSTSQVAAQEAAQANNPLANTKSLNFQNQYLGDLSGTDRDANQFYLRYAQPFSAMGGDWLARFTAPITTVPEAGGGDHTGFGDLNFFAAYLIDVGNPAISFGVGPQITMPTAEDDRLGSGKWSLGFANVLFNATSPKFQWGYLLTWQASVAGDDDREDVNVGAFQPFGFYQLGDGWYLRSASVWTYNFENDEYGVPLSLGVGKVIKTDKAVVNVFVEPQKYVWTSDEGQPDWGVFAGVNFQF